MRSTPASSSMPASPGRGAKPSPSSRARAMSRKKRSAPSGRRTCRPADDRRPPGGAADDRWPNGEIHRPIAQRKGLRPESADNSRPIRRPGGLDWGPDGVRQGPRREALELLDRGLVVAMDADAASGAGRVRAGPLPISTQSALWLTGRGRFFGIPAFRPTCQLSIYQGFRSSNARDHGAKPSFWAKADRQSESDLKDG